MINIGDKDVPDNASELYTILSGHATDSDDELSGMTAVSSLSKVDLKRVGEYHFKQCMPYL